MKKSLILFIACVLIFSGCSVKPSVSDMHITDYLADQKAVDESLLREAEKKYSFSEPFVVVNPYGNAPLSAVAIFETDEETGGTVCVIGDAEEDNVCINFDAEKKHFVPIIGLYPNRQNKVVITLDDNRQHELTVETESVSVGLEQYSVDMVSADDYDYASLTICGNMLLHAYYGYDSKGDIRWTLQNTGANALTVLENGHFLVPNIYGHGSEFPNGLTGIREMDAIGKVYNTYVWNGGQHHEIIVLNSGNYMCTGSKPGYETNRDYVFEIEKNTGDVVWELNIGDVITPGSSGCSSDKGADWCHCNALAYNRETDTLMISCRHLSAVIAVDYSDKTLKWILGDPAGWSDEYSKYLLTGCGDDFDWAYGQHEISLLSDGNLLMFDNGTFSRVKAINENQALPKEKNYSRVVVYCIDDVNMTVSKKWEYGKELGAAYQADSMSGIQVIDEKGSEYLVCFGTCSENDKTLTHVQLIKEKNLVWELNYQGSSTYRAARIDMNDISNYILSATGNWLGDIGTTKQLEDIELSMDSVQPAPEGVCVDRFPFNALRFSGFVNVSEDELTDYYVVLSSESRQYVFDLGYTKQNTADGIKITLSRWISLNGLDSGAYSVDIVMNDVVYETGKNVRIENK